MKLSARNQLPGTVTKVTKGATTSHVTIDIGHGLVTLVTVPGSWLRAP